jgi:hypothetical protein
MNLATIEMDRKAAAAAVRSYRAAVRVARPIPEDVQLLRGYRQLARGRRLISLAGVFAAAGFAELTWRVYNGDRTGQAPKLAICDATAETCFYDGQHFMAERTMKIRSGALVGRDWVRCPIQRERYAPNLETIVPLVPVQLRPAGGLGGYHVLWEVESWSVARPRRAPGDPALVKWIGGDLWAVLAVWDLTELERLIIMGRAR